MTLPRRTMLAGFAVTLASLPAWAQNTGPVRLRGRIESVSGSQLVLLERSGDRVELALAPNLTVSEVYPVTLADVKPGSFIGVGAMPQADGTQRAIAVTLFPEAMRGTGEGHRPFDFLPQSTMTNATVAEVLEAFGADADRIFRRYGLYCSGCHHSTAESIETAARQHGIDRRHTDALVNELRSAFERSPDARDRSHVVDQCR